MRPARVMVVVEARHLCMEMRGLAKPGLVTRTSGARGAFATRRRRREFVELLALRRGAQSRSGRPGAL